MNQVKRGKRVLWPERGSAAVEDFQVGKLKPHEVLIKTVSTLICSGTETAFLMALPNTPMWWMPEPGRRARFPTTPPPISGLAGVIAEVGDDVSQLEVGDRVTARTWHASHVIASEDRPKIPKNVSFDESTFAEFARVGLWGVRLAGIELGESVVVIGLGVIGQLTLQLARLSGARPVIGVDLIDYRLELSSKCGADYVLNPSKVDLEKEVQKITHSKGAEVVIDATGNPKMIPTTFKLSAKYGRVVLLGCPREPFHGEIDFYSDFNIKCLTYLGARGEAAEAHKPYHGRGLWTEREHIELGLNLISSNDLKVKRLISLKLPLNRAPEAYKRLIESKDHVGIILDWITQES